MQPRVIRGRPATPADPVAESDDGSLQHGPRREAGASLNVCKMASRTILLVHLNVFLYSLCFWIQVNVLPFLSKNIGVDTLTFGYLQSTISFLQLLGGPLIGR